MQENPSQNRLINSDFSHEPPDPAFRGKLYRPDYF